MENEKNDLNIKKEKMFSILTGVLAGFINGLFGGGGGMMVVPMLSKLLRYPAKVSHATAILIILPFSILSGLLYAYNGNCKLSVLFPAGIGVIIGGVLGALLLKKLSSKWVVIIFSVVMAVAGVKLLLF